MIKKTVVGAILFFVLVVTGFVYLLRSCLAKYDERAAISRPLVFQQNGKAIIFSLVKFDKTTSYSQKAGFTSKSVFVTYSVQANDAFTGEKIKETTVKSSDEIKYYPVEIICSSGNIAWVFANELMAYDPFSMEKKVDTKIIETKNPALTGKFSHERKYYEYDRQNDKIYITLIDGSKFQLDTKTLIMTAADDVDLKDQSKTRVKELADALKKIQKESEENFKRFRDNNKSNNPRQIFVKAYQDSMNRFTHERERLDNLRDSIYKLQSASNEEVNHFNSIKNRTRFLENDHSSFGTIKVNADSFFQKWYGLYTADELEKVSDQFDYRSSYDDAARNKLYTTGLTVKDVNKKYPDWILGEEKHDLGNDVYLQGGFLLDKQTGMPVHLNDPAGFLIVYKESIGNDGLTLISRVDTSGKKLWTMHTELKSLSFWLIQNDRMIITGTDNKELSSGQNNVLHTIDLNTGQFKTFDFFTDKMRNTKPGSTF